MEKQVYEEKELKVKGGFKTLFSCIFLMLLGIAAIIFGGILMDVENYIIGVPLLVVGVIIELVSWIPLLGLRVVKPNEALVVTLFGKYKGTVKKEGFFAINPFSVCVNPGYVSPYLRTLLAAPEEKQTGVNERVGKNISLKAMTLVNDKQKVNDEMGNPIEVGIVVIWKIVDTAKACFNVENYRSFVSTQSDSALRDVVRTYPYDISENGDEKSLRGSSLEVSEQIKNEIQKRVDIAGIEILEARITHLAYATEIAAAMLQRQQATAIIEARQKIVEGAVGMVEMALNMLNEGNICELDEERKAQMVSNLLVVLCGNKDAQPIVNSGSIY